MRPEAGASRSAIAGARRSPSPPRSAANPEVVTATSLTGTCQGPTSGSRLIMPPTLRSPIVTRNPLSAIAGSRSRRSSASPASSPRPSNPSPLRVRRVARSAACAAAGRAGPATGMSTTRSPARESSTTSRPSSEASPITANGQRSRRHSATKSSSPSGREREHVALLRLVAPDLERRHARLVIRHARQARCVRRRARRLRARRSTGRRRRRRGSSGSGLSRPAPSRHR